MFADDTITYRQSIAALTDFKNRPERGLLVTLGEAVVGVLTGHSRPSVAVALTGHCY